ncbi:RpiB/LacA/LacB family sugar-phosphate isomerase [Paenarthrobacter sp. TYUT067]|uniref:RpiB/LacA/LacB family sugar-phosphate isomerase n=1 Tax=Paenarthrobacter sp. TYUT067 TaxID=2926245 RepID=UPI00202F94B9|nr:RpiB/LacA/LacB family sugar-phosphate isomerase [Paenarthrobacter sp. TYUT067]MCM0616843.1 RpiB/LacA/LacB family sugar-phosphate isomerase [Paenarthrobacter sp. TYUT067]
MRIHLSADHTGFNLAQSLLARLRERGHEVNYHGPSEFDDGDDYPKFTVATGQAVIADEDLGQPSLGIVVGATGIGEQITANKVKGIRAVVGTNPETITTARVHHDANVLTLGALSTSAVDALSLVDVFLSEKFTFEDADVRRILHTAEFENSGTIEGWMIDSSAQPSGS